jgi:hypothetical protein
MENHPKNEPQPIKHTLINIFFCYSVSLFSENTVIQGFSLGVYGIIIAGWSRVGKDPLPLHSSISFNF